MNGLNSPWPVVVVFILTGCISIGLGAEIELDRRAAEAVAGSKAERYYMRLKPFVIRKAPPVPGLRIPSITLPAGEPLQVRVNCGMDFHEGGWQYRDENGNLWLADRVWRKGAQWGVRGGGAGVRNPRDFELPQVGRLAGMYRAERYAMDGYTFHLPPGGYTVRLHFVESYRLEEAEVGRRVFDVTVGGDHRLSDFDPVAAGGPGKPIVRAFEGVQVGDEPLEIGFSGDSAEPPLINGIEIIGAGPLDEPFDLERGDVEMVGGDVELPDPPGPAVGRFLCGVAYRDLPGYELVTEYGGRATWLPDLRGAVNGFWAERGGAGQRHWPIDFTNSPCPQVLSHERFGTDGYQIKVPSSGTYAVRLHFAEGFEGVYRPGLRVFDVSVEGRNILQDFDPVAAGGGFAFAGVFEVRGIEVADGQLSVGFHEKVQSPIISAIEVFEDRSGASELSVRQIVAPARREPLSPEGRRRKLRVFYVGNSHTFFWAIPESVAAAVNSAPGTGLELVPYRLLHGGKVLSWFYRKHSDPDAPSALSIMEAGRYDVAVLQLLPKNDRDFNARMLEALRAFADVADKVGTRLMLYVFNPLEAMDKASRDELLNLAADREMVIVPFGEARRLLWEKAGDAPRPLSMRGVGPHLGFHPAYLDVCTHYIAWTGSSPVGHPVPAMVGQDVRVDPLRARFLQELAWDAYQEASKDYDLGSFSEAR